MLIVHSGTFSCVVDPLLGTQEYHWWINEADRRYFARDVDLTFFHAALDWLTERDCTFGRAYIREILYDLVPTEDHDQIHGMVPGLDY